MLSTTSQLWQPSLPRLISHRKNNLKPIYWHQPHLDTSQYPSSQATSPNEDYIHWLFHLAMDDLTVLVEQSRNKYEDNNCPCDIALGSSAHLPLDTSSIDAVITSPPYCTRIDYVIATLPELAILGLRPDELKGLRDKMIGTPTIPLEQRDPLPPGCEKTRELWEELRTTAPSRPLAIISASSYSTCVACRLAA